MSRCDCCHSSSLCPQPERARAPNRSDSINPNRSFQWIIQDLVGLPNAVGTLSTPAPAGQGGSRWAKAGQPLVNFLVDS